MFDDKIRATRTQLAALETDLELLGKTATQMATELHTMQDRLTGLLKDEAGADIQPAVKFEIPVPGQPYQIDDAWWVQPHNINAAPERWDPAIHSATRSVTPNGHFRRRRTVQKPASGPEAPEVPPEPGNGSDSAEGVSAADTGPPPVPAVVSMKQYISATESVADVEGWINDAIAHKEAGWYTETDLADIKLTAEKRLKTLEERS